MRAAVVVLAVIVAAGCGGGEDAGGGGDDAARAEYIERGDALCREANRFIREDLDPEFREVDERVQASGDEERFLRRYAELLDRDAEQLEGHTERFAALVPPAGSEQTHDAIVRDLRRQQVLSREVAEAYRDGDLERAEAPSRELDEIDDRLERVVRRYGFVDCADPAADPGLTPRAEYIARGDALCHDKDRDQRRHFDTRFDEIDAEAERSRDYERFIDRYRALVEDEANRFEQHVGSFAALEPPPGSADVHEEIVRGLRHQLVLSRRQVAAYRAGDLDGAESIIEEKRNADERLDTIMRRHGFTACSRPG